MNFNTKETKEKCVQWIRNWFNENGAGCNAIIGISGGKDSSVVAALCVEALGKDRVIGVLMPNGYQLDYNDAEALCEHLDIKNFTIDIGEPYYAVISELESAFSDEINISNQTKINLAPRLRMATLYAVAQSMNGRVANTCNLSEDWVGYSTKYGDAAGDFSPLGNLTKTEVCLLGHELGLPANLVDKEPSDGLCGKTDEDNLGFTYDELDDYILYGICKNKKIKEKIDYLHKKNAFKLEPIETFIC